jgi:hypothetical protein
MLRTTPLAGAGGQKCQRTAVIKAMQVRAEQMDDQQTELVVGGQTLQKRGTLDYGNACSWGSLVGQVVLSSAVGFAEAENGAGTGDFKFLHPC